MLSCREASRLASEKMDGKLSLSKRLSLRMHLLMCAACRTYSRQVRAIEELVRRRFGGGEARGGGASAGGGGLSEEARTRIQEVVGKEGKDR